MNESDRSSEEAARVHRRLEATGTSNWSWDLAAEGLSELKDRALDASGEGITISDPSLPDNPIIYANRGFERLTGYRADEVVGRNCRFLQGPDTEPSAVAELRRAVRERREATVELLNYRRDGTPFWNRLTITPVRDAAGFTTHFVGVQSDVSERRNAEAALEAARRELERANDRMLRGLEAAAAFQRSLLPSRLPSIPGLEVAWAFQPCDELAGDSLNVVRLDERHYGFYVLDVSGHGVPAALLAVTLTRLLDPVSGASLLLTEDREGDRGRVVSTPSEVARALNRHFRLDVERPQYFTLFYGVLDVETRRVRYVTAGHPPPIHRPAGGAPAFLPVRCLPVGLIEEVDFREGSVLLAPGDRLYLYTDGLVESARPGGEEFGFGRLLERLRGETAEPLAGEVEEIAEAARGWAGGHLADDLSLLALEAVDDE